MTLPDIDSLSTLGGVKVNSYSVVDPTTDLDADEDNKARCDVAMMSRLAPRLWVQFTAAATTGAIVLQAWDAAWKAQTTTAPVIVREALGEFSITMPSTVLDELGVSHTLNLRAGWTNNGGLIGGDTWARVRKYAPDELRVYITDAAAAADDGVGTTFDIFAI